MIEKNNVIKPDITVISYEIRCIGLYFFIFSLQKSSKRVNSIAKSHHIFLSVSKVGENHTKIVQKNFLEKVGDNY